MEAEIVVEAITPLLVGGWCSKAKCDGDEGLRASSVRGVAREFFRNVAHYMLSDWKKVYKVESKLFGSTEQASPFIVRVEPLDSSFDVSCWLRGAKCLRETSGSGMFRAIEGGMSPYAKFKINVLTRRKILENLSYRIPENKETLLKTFTMSVSLALSILGVGKRRSRGMGRLLPVEVRVNNKEISEEVRGLYRSLWFQQEGKWDAFANSVNLLIGGQSSNEVGQNSPIHNHLFVRACTYCEIECREVSKLLKKIRFTAKNWNRAFIAVTKYSYLCPGKRSGEFLVGILHGFKLFKKARKSEKHSERKGRK